MAASNASRFTSQGEENYEKPNCHDLVCSSKYVQMLHLGGIELGQLT